MSIGLNALCCILKSVIRVIGGGDGGEIMGRNNGVRHHCLMYRCLTDRAAKAGLRFSKSRRWWDGADEATALQGGQAKTPSSP